MIVVARMIESYQKEWNFVYIVPSILYISPILEKNNLKAWCLQ